MIPHMKKFLLFLLIILTVVSAPTKAAEWRTWEFIADNDLQITIKPDKPAVEAGEMATFTITIRNKTDKAIDLPFKTGQRYDMAAFHNSEQVWRWSNGLEWVETSHSIPIRVDRPTQMKLAWRTRDRNGAPLPQGFYRVQGMVMTSPRHLVTDMVDFRLLPPVHPYNGVIKVKLGENFQIELPKYSHNEELLWDIQFEYNDSRVVAVSRRQHGNAFIHVFRGNRRGHVIMHLFAHSQNRDQTESYERRTYRIEINDSF